MRFLTRRLESKRLGAGSYSAVASKAAHSLGRGARRFGPAVAIIASVVLLVGMLLVAWVVREEMREVTRHSLRSILSANVTALEMWLEQTCHDVATLAGMPEVESAARQLLSAPASEPATPRGSEPATPRGSEPATPRGSELEAERQLAAELANQTYPGWALLDARHRVIACSSDALIGLALPIPPDIDQRLRRGAATVCRPFKSPSSIAESGPLSEPGAALMGAMMPYTTGARVIGSLVLFIDPLDRFTELLSVARTGESGETYAFDRNGSLLSQSRFEPQLRSVGLLDADPNTTSPLNVSIRDPGVNLVLGHSTSLPRHKQPLTVMADHATRGATGENVIGYNDYRGVPVVGAWRWLPEYNIGVATEIDVSEAYRPTQLLQRSIVALFVLLGMSLAVLLLLATWFQRLGERLKIVQRTARRLGQYELGEIIGEGGMGTVYRGRHHLLRRDVAIKVLEGPELGKHSVSRFEREVQLTARLRHHNTIDIYDYGRTDDGTFFYVMEYVDGITLQELVDGFGRQPASRVIHLLLQICGSLSEAHQMGMVHRDIKPSNILLTARAGLFDMIKVLDFGLVKIVNRETIELTVAEGITGTPMYMSPEMVRDASTATHQSDLYSVGALGYTLLTGHTLYEGDSTVDICLKQLHENPLRPSERIGQPLPDDLQNVLMSCLSKKPEDRPLSIDDLESTLRHCQDAEEWGTAQALRWWEMEYGALSRPPAAPSGSVPKRIGGQATETGSSESPHATASNEIETGD